MKRVSIALLFLLTLSSAGAWAFEGATAPECREQIAQDFLIRANMKRAKAGFAQAVANAIKYRVLHYGFVPKLTPTYGVKQSAPSQAVTTLFLGKPVKVHKKILAALECVEARIERDCAAHPYQVEHLSGLRTRNTYRGGEVSNHMFGLAVDIDPDRNPCCGCVAPWPDNWKCKRSASPLERVDIPRCWINTFERYGFYWLGWDEMQDTMHFEFLGNPDEVLVGN